MLPEVLNGPYAKDDVAGSEVPLNFGNAGFRMLPEAPDYNQLMT